MGNHHSTPMKKTERRPRAQGNKPALHISGKNWKFLENFKRNRTSVTVAETGVEDVVVPILELDIVQPINGGLDGVFDRRTSTNLLSPSPHTMTRSTSDAFSFRSDGPKGNTWNEAQLLIFFDGVRQAMADVQASTSTPEVNGKLDDDPIPSFRLTKGRQQLECLIPGISKTLSELIEDEQSGQKPISRDFITHTHIDMLLEELLGYSNVVDICEESKRLGRLASVLMGMWEHRLMDIPNARMAEMRTIGCHRHMQRIEFGPDWELHDEVVWQVDNIALPTRAQGALGFKPGQWWLNMYCCMRDGVVKSATEIVTHGRYGVTALAMTEGVEVDGARSDEVVYTIEGPSRKMPFALLTTKQAIRVIRGSRLKSPYAPCVGVRYDGLYKIVTYSHSSFPGKGSSKMTYKGKIVLNRVENQVLFETAMKHPTPSEVDQFDLYWGGVRVQMREWQGEKRFGSWCWVSPEEESWRERREKRRRRLGDGGKEMGKGEWDWGGGIGKGYLIRERGMVFGLK